MGFQFNRSGIGEVAPGAMANHRQRLRRLYEHAWRYGKDKTRALVGEYVRRLKIWKNFMFNALPVRAARSATIRPKSITAATNQPIRSDNGSARFTWGGLWGCILLGCLLLPWSATCFGASSCTTNVMTAQLYIAPGPVQGAPLEYLGTPNSRGWDEICSGYSPGEAVDVAWVFGNNADSTLFRLSGSGAGSYLDELGTCSGAYYCAAMTTPNGTLACSSGSGGTPGMQSAIIPIDATRRANKLVALLHCHADNQGTLRVRATLTPGNLLRNSRGLFGPSAPNWTGSVWYSHLSFGGVGAVVLGSPENVAASVSDDAERPAAGTIHWGYKLQTRNIGTGDGLESCVISAPGTVDFGTVGRQEIPTTQASASQILNNPLRHEVTVTASCTGVSSLPSAGVTVKNGWIGIAAAGPTLADTSLGNTVGSSDPNLGFAVQVVGPAGDTCNTFLSGGCPTLSTSTTGGTTRTVYPNQMDQRDFRLVFVPVRVPDGESTWGRITATLTINYFYPW